jgi:hypothetical protein
MACQCSIQPAAIADNNPTDLAGDCVWSQHKTRPIALVVGHPYEVKRHTCPNITNNNIKPTHSGQIWCALVCRSNTRIQLKGISNSTGGGEGLIKWTQHTVFCHCA